MLRWLRSAFWTVTRLILSLRYRVLVHGLEQARRLKRPALILPNHPGYIDPAVVITALWSTLRPRPMIWEGLFFYPDYLRTTLSTPIVKVLGAVLMRDIERPSAEARARAKQAIAGVVEGL